MSPTIATTLCCASRFAHGAAGRERAAARSPPKSLHAAGRDVAEVARRVHQLVVADRAGRPRRRRPCASPSSLSSRSMICDSSSPRSSTSPVCTTTSVAADPVVLVVDRAGGAQRRARRREIAVEIADRDDAAAARAATFSRDRRERARCCRRRRSPAPAVPGAGVRGRCACRDHTRGRCQPAVRAMPRRRRSIGMRFVIMLLALRRLRDGRRDAPGDARRPVRRRTTPRARAGTAWRRSRSARVLSRRSRPRSPGSTTPNLRSRARPERPRGRRRRARRESSRARAPS